MQLSYDNSAAIIAQNAGTTAAALLKVYGETIGGVTEQNFLDLFNEFRKEVFDGTNALAGAGSTVQSFESSTSARPTTAAAPRSTAGSGGASGGADPGTVVVKFGKWAGQTIAQIAEQDASYVEWLAENSNNDFVRGRAEAFLAA